MSDLVADLRSLLAVAICPQCDGSGTIVDGIGYTEYVSRDMAIDAGDRSLEGSVYRHKEPEIYECEWCARRKAAINQPSSST
jgi:hypothetical protein